MNWTDYFLNIAKEVSKKSKDVHTQCGCILVHNNKIIGTGYNSFPRLMNDDNLPTTRPEKYDWMIHSERNALLNRTMIVDAFKAYMTTKPCFAARSATCVRMRLKISACLVMFQNSAGGDKPYITLS